MLNKRILTLIFVVAFLTLLIGCLPSQNETPIITSDPVKTGEVGVDYTYDVNATDPDEDVLTYSLVTKPTGMVINPTTGLINWTPAVPGDFSVVVKVSDGDLDITQSFTIAVIEEEEPGVTPTPSAKLTSIVVDPKEMTLFVRGYKAITSVTATYEIRGFEVLVALGECTYTSSAIGVATVEKVENYFSAFVVKAGETEGTATITVTYKGKTDTIAVTVSALPPQCVGSYSYSWTTTIMGSTDFDFTVGMGWSGPFPYPPNVYYFFHPDEIPLGGYTEPIGGAWLFGDIDFDITSAGQTFSVTDGTDFEGFANLLTNGTDEVIWFGYIGDRDKIASAGGQKGVYESEVFSGTDVGTDFPGYIIKDISLTFDQIYLDSANANKLVLDFTIDIYAEPPTP